MIRERGRRPREGGRRVGFCRIGLVAVIALWGLSSRADDAMLVIGNCKLATVGAGVVGAVVDPSTIMLDGAREVSLAAIEVPASRGDDARRALDALVGEQVTLRNLAPVTDRYGRIHAHLFVGRGAAARWIQSELVGRGAARVAARVGSRACANELLAHERAARNAKLGLWAEPDYAIRSAEDPAGIAADRGGFAIVEGRVLSVRESGATIYVNFGRRWSQDFTVTVLKRNERSFAAEGLEPKRLERRRVRVRGYVEERGGPWIEAVRPEQIEIVE